MSRGCFLELTFLFLSLVVFFFQNPFPVGKVNVYYIKLGKQLIGKADLLPLIFCIPEGSLSLVSFVTSGNVGQSDGE